jgi:ABC-type bacteriocin/lantibiotic exporter with double-glycine peptidase domain
MQRVGIARALYQDPEFLVLDEATSSLDPETEQLVMEAVDELRGEKTVVIIAHKQAILHKCNRVIRIEKGRIISDDVDLELSPELQAKS